MNTETMDTTEEAEALFKGFREDVSRRQLSNTENYDRAVLTLSSGALGISATFLGSAIDLGSATHIWVLILSWALLVVAMVLTLWSFRLSQVALGTALKNAKQYYIDKKRDAPSAKNPKADATERCATWSGVAFAAGIIMLLVFVGMNSFKEVMQVESTNKESVSPEQEQEPSKGKTKIVEMGASVPKIHIVHDPGADGGGGKTDKGANVPSIQPISDKPAPSTPDPAPSQKVPPASPSAPDGEGASGGES